jgi:arginyl-tRNA synthetase
MNLLTELKSRFRLAIEPLTADPDALLEMIRPAQDPRFGDYQANCAMSLGKQLGRSPREVAEEIVGRLEIDDLCHSPQVAGPGFINLQFRDDWLSDQLQRLLVDPRLGVAPPERPRTYVIDYSAPNIAKPMHVGHIRSTVIGDALCRTLRFLGHPVIADNHLGDWGTQFGMIIYGFRHFVDTGAYARNPVAELGRVYRVVRQLMDYQRALDQHSRARERLMELQRLADDARCLAQAAPQDKKRDRAAKKLQGQVAVARQELESLQETIESVQHDPARADAARQHPDIQQAVLRETAKLHLGDPDSIRLWKEFLPKCRLEIQRIYDRLGIQFDVELGESFYHDQLASVVEDFVARGLARESDGAICIFLDGFDAPMIIRKQDGAFLYATTDLATIRYRMQTWSPDAILYVVDFRQAEHFQKLFAVARQWGYREVELRHIEFGTVLGDDGKPFRTRAGDTVGLESLLDAAVERARQVVSENDDAKPGGAELSEAQREHVAHVVGHAAIKYADLSQNRASDYVYSEEKMVALKGNTATYLQYSYARVINIFARGKVDPESLRRDPAELTLPHDKERQLALALLRLPEACDEVLIDYRPNHLTGYLFELATRFSEFYEACPVLKAESDEQRMGRLKLCDLVARTLELGLSLLGIQIVDKM